MKKLDPFLIILTVLAFRQVYSVPAPPNIKHVKIQPDGTQIILVQWGDEFLHGFETVEGYTVVKNKNGYYVYANVDFDGSLVPTNRIVGIDPPPNIQKHIRPTRKGIMVNSIHQKLPIHYQTVDPSGTGKLPVVLINFADTQTIYTVSDFTNLFFSISGDSLRKYYKEVSYNVFDLEGGVFGWYMASQNHDYYGADSQSNPANKDLRVQELIREAAQLSDADINFTEYDTDGDCYVDMFAVIHQGRGQEDSSDPNDIWSHRSRLSTEFETNDSCLTGGLVKIRDYIIMPETLESNNSITTIGVLAHEYGHALGLPDLYDTDYSSNGIGKWGLMGFGSWNSKPSGLIGSSPAHLSAWSKAKLGWTIPRVIHQSVLDMVIEPIELNRNHVFQFIVGTPGDYGEYFLVENRQKIGFDEGLPAEGLLIWHIDESILSNRNECRSFHGDSSCITTHYKLALEQADGSLDLENDNNDGDVGDVFPYNPIYSDSFSDSSIVRSSFYDGNSSGVNIRNIRRDGDNIIIDVINPGNYPDILVNPTEVDFGVVGIDDEYITVNVLNNGNHKLRILNINLSGSTIFEIHYTSTCYTRKYLLPWESCTIVIEASNRNNIGGQRGTLTIQSDDPDEPLVSVAIRSSALPIASGCGRGCNSVPGIAYSFIALALIIIRFLLKLVKIQLFLIRLRVFSETASGGISRQR